MARVRKSRTELHSHDVTISSFNARFSIRAFMERGMRDAEIEGGPWLTLRGTLTEPIRGMVDIEISIHATDTLQVGTARPACVAAMIQIRPQVVLVLTVTHQDFDRLWLLTNSGNLRHAHFVATEPRYGKALAVNVSFSNEPTE